MPKRHVLLRDQEIYHVFNRGIDKRVTFSDSREYERAYICMNYYLHISPATKLSNFLRAQGNNKPPPENVGKRHADLLCFCLMPNHFHFLLRQLHENGISKYLSNFQNSYTRYFNTKHERTGPLFSTQFKAVRIENLNQLLHINRYIHLNPFSSDVVKKAEEVFSYPWSSLKFYVESNYSQLIDKNTVLANFRSLPEYKRFIINQANYQKSLKKIENLVLEN